MIVVDDDDDEQQQQQQQQQPLYILGDEHGRSYIRDRLASSDDPISTIRSLQDQLKISSHFFMKNVDEPQQSQQQQNSSKLSTAAHENDNDNDDESNAMQIDDDTCNDDEQSTTKSTTTTTEEQHKVNKNQFSSIFDFTDLLGVNRHVLYKSLMNHLKQQLLTRISTLNNNNYNHHHHTNSNHHNKDNTPPPPSISSSTATTTSTSTGNSSNNNEALQLLLEQVFPYIHIEELRSIVHELLSVTNCCNLPNAIQDRLKQSDIFVHLPVQVKVQLWQNDATLFHSYLDQLLREYDATYDDQFELPSFKLPLICDMTSDYTNLDLYTNNFRRVNKLVGSLVGDVLQLSPKHLFPSFLRYCRKKFVEQVTSGMTMMTSTTTNTATTTTSSGASSKQNSKHHNMNGTNSVESIDDNNNNNDNKKKSKQTMGLKTSKLASSGSSHHRPHHHSHHIHLNHLIRSLGELRYDVLMTAHDKKITQIHNNDLSVHKFCWLIDAWLRTSSSQLLLFFNENSTFDLYRRKSSASSTSSGNAVSSSSGESSQAPLTPLSAKPPSIDSLSHHMTGSAAASSSTTATISSSASSSSIATPSSSSFSSSSAADKLFDVRQHQVLNVPEMVDVRRMNEFISHFAQMTTSYSRGMISSTTTTTATSPMSSGGGSSNSKRNSESADVTSLSNTWLDIQMIMCSSLHSSAVVQQLYYMLELTEPGTFQPSLFEVLSSAPIFDKKRHEPIYTSQIVVTPGPRNTVRSARMKVKILGGTSKRLVPAPSTFLSETDF